MAPQLSLFSFHNNIHLNNKMRVQLLITSLCALAGALLFVFFKLPFDTIFFWAMAASSLMHLLFFVFYKYFKPFAFILMGYINIFLMGFVIHATGGALSPYTVIFAAILISNITFGISTPLDLPLVIFVYISVIFMEYFGVIAKPSLCTYTIYQNNAATIISFMISVLMFLIMSGYLEKIIVKNLQAQLTSEQEKNDKYKEQINKVNNIYQIGFMSSQLIHELNNPLTAIDGYVSLVLKSNKLDTQLREDMTIVHEGLNHCNSLIKKFSKFVKPGDGIKDSFMLNEVADICVAILRMDTNFKTIDFLKRYDNEDQYFVFGCREEVQQVFYNLMKNAAEAIYDAPKRKGIIEIILERTDGHIEVSIKDNGKGMEASVLKETFSHFFTTKTQGMGLGMGIVKSILESHKSKLHISSELDKGTKVSFTLPIPQAIKNKVL